MKTARQQFVRRSRSSLFGLALGTVLVSLGADVRADVPAACAGSFENAQVFMKKGQYVASRRELSACIRDCPSEFQRQCTQWFGEVDTLMPSIVVHADANGDKRTDVKVEMDGNVLAEKLDGKGISMDPGEHHFTFTTAGYPPLRMQIILHRGEQLRTVRVRFERPEDAARAAPVVPPPPSEAPVSREFERPVPNLVYVLGGVAVVGAVGFAALGITANNERTEFEAACSPRCRQDEVRALHNKLVLADVSLGVSLAALTAGTILWLVRPSVPVRNERASFDIVPTRTGATATATILF